ncbi:hypothetical protein HAZT_HAZT003984 [Hyalella azteca]|nr:hypothetical protein HAZT_HAZT003984 [Hyalella azteca]
MVRLKLELMKPFLEAPVSTNLQLIYLVRDPRAVINSRRSTVKWCKPRDLDCYSPAVLCADMEDDLHAYKTFKKLYPDRVHLVRYEDLMANVSNQVKILTEKMGLDFHPSMQRFVRTHTTKEINSPTTTWRRSKDRLLYWTRRLRASTLREIQLACGTTMEKFGYKLVENLSRVNISHVLTDIEH